MATVKALKPLWASDKLIADTGQETEMSDDKAKFHESKGSVQIIKAKTKELKFQDGNN